VPETLQTVSLLTSWISHPGAGSCQNVPTIWCEIHRRFIALCFDARMELAALCYRTGPLSASAIDRIAVHQQQVARTERTTLGT
jgi:hypothetical protein